MNRRLLSSCLLLALAMACLLPSAWGWTDASFSDVAEGQVTFQFAESFPAATPTATPTAIAAGLRLEPGVLQRTSQADHVTAFVTLPAGYDASRVDLATVRLCRWSQPCGASGVLAEEGKTTKGGGNGQKGGKLKVTFDFAAVLALVAGLPDRSDVTLTVSGEITLAASTVTFAGQDTVRVQGPASTSTPTPTATADADNLRRVPIGTASATPSVTSAPGLMPGTSTTSTPTATSSVVPTASATPSITSAPTATASSPATVTASPTATPTEASAPATTSATPSTSANPSALDAAPTKAAVGPTIPPTPTATPTPTPTVTPQAGAEGSTGAEAEQ